MVFHPDHLGSTTLITDRHGNITQFITYLPFGELLVNEHTTSRTTPFKFTGKELDSETGLYYFGYRYFDPRIAKWLGVDPLWELYPHIGGFVYTLQNPIRFVDPDGRVVFPSATELRNAGNSVVNDNRFAARNGNTFCNLGAQAINTQSGDNSVTGRANDMGNFLRNPDNATSLSQQEALDLANQGAVVFASFVSEGSGPGHIAVVAPTESLTFSNQRNEDVVSVFNVGRTNDEMSLARAFGTRDVGLFILNEGLDAINDRTRTFDGGALPETSIVGQRSESNRIRPLQNIGIIRPTTLQTEQ